MAKVDVFCPECSGSNVVKFGLSAENKQRYYCQNSDCKKKTFILNYTNKGHLPEIKTQIIDMAINGSGVRDTSRVLGISINTVMSELKKALTLESVNKKLLEKHQENKAEITVGIVKVEEAEFDEMWSYVGKKGNQRWLWHAIDHNMN